MKDLVTTATIIGNIYLFYTLYIRANKLIFTKTSEVGASAIVTLLLRNRHRDEKLAQGLRARNWQRDLSLGGVSPEQAPLATNLLYVLSFILPLM